MRRKFLLPVLLLAAVFAGACSPRGEFREDPKKRLTDYIAKSFAVKNVEDRKALQSYLGGTAKVRLSAWSDDQFQQAFIESKRKFLCLVFLEVKSPTPTETSITYELTYLDQSRGRDAKVTNKKLCRLVLEQGKWNIHEVRNIKELVEYQNEMALP